MLRICLLTKYRILQVRKFNRKQTRGQSREQKSNNTENEIMMNISVVIPLYTIR